MSDIDDLAEARAKLRDKGGAWRAQLLLSATKDPRPLLAMRSLRCTRPLSGVACLAKTNSPSRPWRCVLPPGFVPMASGHSEPGVTGMTL